MSEIKVVVRVDGSKWIGMGHLTRMFDLSSELIRQKNVSVTYLVKNSKAARRFFEGRDVSPVYLPARQPKVNEVSIVVSLLESLGPSVLIVDDLNFVIDRKRLSQSAELHDLKVIIFSDSTTKKLIDADLVVNVNPNQKQDFYSSEVSTRYCVGLDYFIAPREYQLDQQDVMERKTVKNVAICMGGSDSRSVTLKVLRALARADGNFKLTVVVGSTFYKIEDFEEFKSNMNERLTVLFDSKNLYKTFKEADIVVTSGGNVHIERLILGVPGLVICQSHRELEITKIVERQNAVLNLGLHNETTEDSILIAFSSLCRDFSRRLKLSMNSKQNYDGLGASKLAKIILDL